MRILTPGAFGSRLREARKLHGLNQMQLGKLVGVGQPAVCAWEKGERLPEQSRWNDIADALKTTAADLFFELG